MKRLGDRTVLVTGSPNTLVISDGDGGVLVVDPGIGEGRGRLIAEAAGGRRVEVVLTHGHTDHLAAARELGARVVAAHRLCIPLVESSVARRALVYGGLVSAKTAAMPMVELRVHRVLEWGERIADGVYAVGLPGHTPGHTGVLVEDDAVLAAGDAVVGERVLQRYGIPFALDARMWVESISAIERLVEKGYTLVPGHGPIVRGERALQMLEANRSAVRRARELLLEMLKEPLTREEAAYRLTVQLTRSEPGPRQLLLNSVIVSSLLAWLEEEGLVEPVATEHGVAWRRVRK